MSDIDQALDNLNAIKNGDDPRASDEETATTTANTTPTDALTVARLRDS